MASLYKRKGSSKWWIKIYRTGRRKTPDQIPTGTADRDQAQQILDGMIGDKARGLPVLRKAHSLKFWELAEAVLEDYENKGYKSLKHAKLRFNKHINPFLGMMVAANVTKAEIRKYETQRRLKGAKPATIRHELELIKRAYTLCYQSYRIPGPHIDLPTVQNARQGFFEQAEFERVMAAIPEDYRGFLLMAYITGWRSGEIKDLRRRHIDFVNKVIRLDPGTKNGDARVFPMIGGLEEMLRKQLPAAGFSNDYVFTYRPPGKDIAGKDKPRRAVGDFGKAFNTACYKAGLPCVTEDWSFVEPKSGKTFTGVRVLKASRIPHDFRRTAVRNLTRMGIPEKVAMDMCGHRTREVFDRYRIVSQTDLDLASVAMETAYSGLLSNLNAGTVAGTVSRISKNRAK